MKRGTGALAEVGAAYLVGSVDSDSMHVYIPPDHGPLSMFPAYTSPSILSPCIATALSGDKLGERET